MHGYDLEGADRVTTVGASDITIRIWNELDAAGEQGLTRDEILERVGPHINRGYARRRYLDQRRRKFKANEARANRSSRASPPTWDDTLIEPALAYIVARSLNDMGRLGTAIQFADGRYRAGRQPRHRDPSIIDMTGDRTRIHMNSANALRILEPALRRFETSAHAQLTAQEKAALKRLVELHKEMLRDTAGSE